MNCYFHNDRPAVNACIKCGVGLCHTCMTEAPYSLDGRPVCLNCSMSIAEKELKDACKARGWSIVKCVFSGIFLGIALAAYSSGAGLENVWIIAGISGLPAAFKATRRSKEQKIMDEIHDRYTNDIIDLTFGWVMRLIIKLALIIVLAPLFALISFFSNLIGIFKSGSDIKEANKTIDYINNELYGASEPQQVQTQAVNTPQIDSSFGNSPAAVSPIDNITSVQTSPAPGDQVNPQTPASYPNSNQHRSKVTVTYEKEKTVNKKFIAIAASVAVLIGVSCGYFYWYVPYSIDRDAPRSYVLANNLFMRSSKMAGVEHNIITKIPYGSELITYSDDGEWAEVKMDGQKGYVSSAYLINEQDFNLLHNIWGSLDAKDYIESSKCRLALIDYCNRNNLATGPEGWQLHTLQKDTKPNNVLYPRLDNGYVKFTEFAFILKNNLTGDRRFAIYSFDEETEKPIYLFDEDATDCGLIKNVIYNSRLDQYKVLYTEGLGKQSFSESQRSTYSQSDYPATEEIASSSDDEIIIEREV